MKHRYFWFTGLVVLAIQMLPGIVKAGNCLNATAITNLSGTYSTAVPFTGPCDLTTQNARGYGNPAGCASSVWFLWDPNNPGNCYDLRFTLLCNSGGSAIKAFLLYSESVDAASACAWSGAFPPFGAPTSLPPLSVVASVTHPGATAPTPISFNGRSLDGSGVYFVVVQNAGTAGSVALAAAGIGAASPGPYPNAPNDRCANATLLSAAAGGGVDSSSLVNGTLNAAWSQAICGTNRYATKERPTDECTNGGETEDHWWGFFCTPQTHCGIGNVDANVWYRFNMPSGTPNNGWYIQLGGVTCQNADGALDGYLQVILLDGAPCGSGQNATVRSSCAQTDIRNSASLPIADGRLGPFSLQNNRDYYIMVDSWSYAVCDFKILLTRENTNPVLPVRISYFRGIRRGEQIDLYWETSFEHQILEYEVEQAEDTTFRKIGQIPATGTGAGTVTYSFFDPSPPRERCRYRLKAVDAGGQHWYSQEIEVQAAETPTDWLTVSPNPFSDNLFLDIRLKPSNTCHVWITDLFGKAIWSQSIQAPETQSVIRINTTSLAPGIYLLHAGAPGQGRVSRKIIKE